MRKLSKKEIGELGMYEFQAYIGAMNSPTFGGWKGTDRLIDFLNIEEIENPKILEVGCSTGYISRYLARKFDCEIIGVDLGEFGLGIARQEAEKMNLQNITYQKANVENLPFNDNLFDFVIGEAITALVSDPIHVLREYMRVLKPHGKVATLDLFMKESLNKENFREINDIMSMVIGAAIKIRDLHEWQEIFKKSGLNDIRVYDYYDDIFKREFSFGQLIKIVFKSLYHMIVNKKLRHTLTPLIKFSKKFRKLVDDEKFGYLLFIGIK